MQRRWIGRWQYSEDLVKLYYLAWQNRAGIQSAAAIRTARAWWIWVTLPTVWLSYARVLPWEGLVAQWRRRALPVSDLERLKREAMAVDRGLQAVAERNLAATDLQSCAIGVL